MTIHEYGEHNAKTIVLIHPSVVMWEFFKEVISLLADRYHLIIPALPGYDEDAPQEEFTSVEDIADRLSYWLLSHDIQTIDVLYGCSMGGSVALRMLLDKRLTVKNVVGDGAVTPYQLPQPFPRLLAVRDYSVMALLKLGGMGLLQKAAPSGSYNSEALQDVAKVFDFASYRTLWRNFASCSSYAMPDPVPAYAGRLQYWCGEKEVKTRAHDLHYVKKHYPNAQFLKMKGLGHACMAIQRPQEMARRLAKLAES